MKKFNIKLILVTVSVLVVVLSGCTKDSSGIEAVKLDDSSDRNVTVGDTVFFKAKVYPIDEDCNVVWRTTDDEILTVEVQRIVEGMADRYVAVIARGAGVAKVIVTVNGTFSDSCKITVRGVATGVSLNRKELVLVEEQSDRLTYQVVPEGATVTSVKWYVKDTSVATISQEGEITGLSVGSTWAYVEINSALKDSCKVDVTSNAPVYPEAPELRSVRIHGIWWAPVNCGYKAAAYPFGKLYQWGRKDGSGYNDGSTYVENVLQTAIEGPIDASAEHPRKFYVGLAQLDWLEKADDMRWNGRREPERETSPLKMKDDPCPDGWRVPTYTELSSLIDNRDSISNAGWDAKERGFWFNGTSAPEVGDGIFFPAAGCRTFQRGASITRGVMGYYWSSSTLVGVARSIMFYSRASMIVYPRALGCSVRCVKE